MNLNELRENSQVTIPLGKFVNNAIIKLPLASSFQKMFFIGQKLKHVHMTYFLELLIFFWLALVGIYCLELISHYIKEILHVSPSYTGNQSLNKIKERYIFTCLWYWCWKILFFLVLSKNSLSTILVFFQFHEHIFLKVVKQFFRSGENFKRFLIKKCPCYHVLTIFLSTFLETHRLMYKKLNSFVYIFVVNFQFFQITPSGCSMYKTEYWLALSYE